VAAAAALYLTDREGEYPTGRRLSLRPQTLAYDERPYAAVYGLHLPNTCNYMDYYSFTTLTGWKAELAWMVDP